MKCRIRMFQVWEIKAKKSAYDTLRVYNVPHFFLVYLENEVIIENYAAVVCTPKNSNIQLNCCFCRKEKSRADFSALYELGFGVRSLIHIIIGALVNYLQFLIKIFVAIWCEAPHTPCSYVWLLLFANRRTQTYTHENHNSTNAEQLVSPAKTKLLNGKRKSIINLALVSYGFSLAFRLRFIVCSISFAFFRRSRKKWMNQLTD